MSCGCTMYHFQPITTCGHLWGGLLFGFCFAVDKHWLKSCRNNFGSADFFFKGKFLEFPSFPTILLFLLLTFPSSFSYLQMHLSFKPQLLCLYLYWHFLMLPAIHTQSLVLPCILIFSRCHTWNVMFQRNFYVFPLWMYQMVPIIFSWTMFYIFEPWWFNPNDKPIAKKLWKLLYQKEPISITS